VLLAAMTRQRQDLDPAVARPLLEVRPEYLDAAYDEVRRVHGSFGAYLRDGLGVTDGTVAALRANLLE
jgi:protein-tyrosine phosphatase